MLTLDSAASIEAMMVRVHAYFKGDVLMARDHFSCHAGLFVARMAYTEAALPGFATSQP